MVNRALFTLLATICNRFRKNKRRHGLLFPFRMVCRNSILAEICKSCFSIFGKFIVLYLVVLSNISIILLIVIRIVVLHLYNLFAISLLIMLSHLE